MTKYTTTHVKIVMQLFLPTNKQSTIHCPECGHCGQGFNTKKQIEKHVRVKHQGTFLQCTTTAKETGGKCGKILYSEEGLISHVQCKHVDGHDVCLACSISPLPLVLLSVMLLALFILDISIYFFNPYPAFIIL